jgi:hypothetical protein
MELMTGRTLKDMAGNEKTLSVPDAMAKILDVLEGLEEAHEHLGFFFIGGLDQKRTLAHRNAVSVEWK